MSNPWHLATVLQLVGHIHPKRILDVGIGTGTYGFMIRQFLDISQERLKKEEWQLTIDGIELFEPYRNPVWSYAYDQVFMGDIREVLPTAGKYDLVVCNDVLEHFPQAEATQLVGQFLEHAPVVIATTPNREWPQTTWAGNEAETHHCLLGAEDFPHLAAQVITGVTTCFVSCAEPKLAASLQEAVRTCPRITKPVSATLVGRISNKWRKLKER